MSYLPSQFWRAEQDGLTGCERDVHRAQSLFERFHRFCPPRMVRERCRRLIPKVLVDLGRLRALVYSAERGPCGPRTFIHFMETPPRLACNPEGTQLYILGGRYQVTRRGIEG